MWFVTCKFTLACDVLCVLGKVLCFWCAVVAGLRGREAVLARPVLLWSCRKTTLPLVRGAARPLCCRGVPGLIAACKTLASTREPADAVCFVVAVRGGPAESPAMRVPHTSKNPLFRWSSKPHDKSRGRRRPRCTWRLPVATTTHSLRGHAARPAKTTSAP